MFVLAFFVISSYMLAYAQGYRIGLSWPPSLGQVVQRTGMILVETDPRGANLFLDGEIPLSLWERLRSEEVENITTPTRLKNIKPGEYTLTITLPDYHTWEREITVQPGRITTITDLQLLKKNLPLRLSASRVSGDHLSPDKNWGFDIENSKLVNLRSGQTSPIPTTTPESHIDWSPDSQRVVIDKKIFEIEEKSSKIDLKEILGSKIQKPKWRNDRELYYLDQGSLYSFNSKTETSKELINTEGRIINHKSLDGYIYLMVERLGKSVLEVYHPLNLEKIRGIDFPLSSGYEIKGTPRSGLVNVHDNDFQILYLLKPLSPIPLKERLDKVEHFDWRGNAVLVYGNGFEIWEFNLNNHDQKLITRLSDRIEGIIVLPSCKKTVYYNQKQIIIIEKENGKINETELASMDHVSDLFVGGQGEDIYFNAQIGSHSGLYKLNIY